MRLRDTAQEMRELGLGGSLFRAWWEAASRLPWQRPVPDAPAPASIDWARRLSLEDPVVLATTLIPLIASSSLTALRATGLAAARGRIRCFGSWNADFGEPVDWHRDPVSGARWPSRGRPLDALRTEGAGDAKRVWEAARFPQAYHLFRTAAFFPGDADWCAKALQAQMSGFVEANPPGQGIQWASGQEIAVRMIAWLVSLDVLLLRHTGGDDAAALVGRSLAQAAAYVEHHLAYARIAVRNNHLLAEALLLFAAGVLLPASAASQRWRRTGRQLLVREAAHQFYVDGGYLQQSHNYHRVALQYYVWAMVFARAGGERAPEAWRLALERSVDFLIAHQNPDDGRLPNYGSNDSALPSLLSSCAHDDMRPTLQAASLAATGQRVYDPGPWDEEAAWLFGVRSLDAPVRRSPARSRSFAVAGHHVLRGGNPRSFAAFRCGTLRDRFSQIDMLHTDIWWHGHNVLIDPGSYQYNGAGPWHTHFMGTAAHNTVMLDGRDQMVHHRQFKLLYWTQAALTRFEDEGEWAHCAGEHTAYARYPGGCVVHRDVIFLKDDVWIVVDRVTGAGRHRARLHWLGGMFPWQPLRDANGFVLETPSGAFTIAAYASDGRPLRGDVAEGRTDEPRGWAAPAYGLKVPVPSFAATLDGDVPMAWVSVLAGATCEVSADAGGWTLRTRDRVASFEIADGPLSVRVSGVA